VSHPHTRKSFLGKSVAALAAFFAAPQFFAKTASAQPPPVPSRNAAFRLQTDVRAVARTDSV
jgi:hypothetical protein